MTAPANDLLVNAANLASGSTQTAGDTTEAGQEADEFRLDNGGTGTVVETGLRTVWFRWKAPSTTSATFTTVGSTFDTYLGVYKAKVGETDPVTSYTQLLAVASDDDSGGGTASSVTITPTTATIYYLQLSGFGSGSGAYTLNYPSPAAISFTTAGPPLARWPQRRLPALIQL